MEFLDFCQAIRTVAEQHDLATKYFLLMELDRLVRNHDADDSFSMTQVSILFEGFYRHLGNSPLKEELGVIRAKRWGLHFGTPTVTFLLSYKIQIDRTTKLFNELTPEVESSIDFPWLINKDNEFTTDLDNKVITDPKSISRVESPHSREVTGIFTKTHNPFGGFTTTPCDPVSQQFITHAALSAKTGGKVLEIGAAFGAATLEAIAKGATVFCNDIDPELSCCSSTIFWKQRMNLVSLELAIVVS